MPGSLAGSGGNICTELELVISISLHVVIPLFPQLLTESEQKEQPTEQKRTLKNDEL